MSKNKKFEEAAADVIAEGVVIIGGTYLAAAAGIGIGFIGKAIRKK